MVKTTLIDMNYIEFLFQNYCDADINQTWEYVCSRWNEIFALGTF